MRSLRSRLFLVWALSLLASVAVGAMMLGLYSRSSAIEFARADSAVQAACEDIRDSYSYYGADWSGPAPPSGDPRFRRDLGIVLTAALADRPLLRAGVWSAGGGLLAQYPAGDAAPPRSAWEVASREAAQDDLDVLRHDDSAAADTVIVAACPLRGAVPGLVAWVAQRVASTAGLFQLRAGLGVLLALEIVIAAWLTWLVLAWSRHVQAIETALASHAAGTGLPTVRLTGERELDRIVAALNIASGRLAAAQQEAAAMSARVAQSERLAALGRIAAGVAHEIRNPIATMRLRAENALAGPEPRRVQALEAMLVQIARLNRLLTALLAMTQTATPVPETTELRTFLSDCAAEQAETAAARGARIAVEAPPITVPLDADMIRRALANLLQNALRETPQGGTVRLAATVEDGHVRISVADSGPGVPAALQDRLFEPFVTGHADGTGLGLSIARELITAHGGTLYYVPGAHGAVFVIELPCRSS